MVVQAFTLPGRALSSLLGVLSSYLRAQVDFDSCFYIDHDADDPVQRLEDGVKVNMHLLQQAGLDELADGVSAPPSVFPSLPGSSLPPPLPPSLYPSLVRPLCHPPVYVPLSLVESSYLATFILFGLVLTCLQRVVLMPHRREVVRSQRTRRAPLCDPPSHGQGQEQDARPGMLFKPSFLWPAKAGETGVF